MDKDKMTVLLVQPNKIPVTIEVGTKLKDLQHIVGGNIEVAYPFDDAVGLVMNEDGKFNGMSLNRALRVSGSGEIYDIVAGDFLVIGLTVSDFCSLTAEQIATYKRLFYAPETFLSVNGKIIVLPAI